MPDHDLHPSLMLRAYPLIPLFPTYHMFRKQESLIGDLIRDILAKKNSHNTSDIIFSTIVEHKSKMHKRKNQNWRKGNGDKDVPSRLLKHARRLVGYLLVHGTRFRRVDLALAELLLCCVEACLFIAS